MQIQIFDVAHGFCALMIADNGNTMLVDCAHNNETGFHPASYLQAIGCVGIQRFFVTNYDEDHLRGLPVLRGLAAQIPIHILHRNESLTVDQLRAIKRQGGPLGEGMKALLEMIDSYGGTVTSPPVFPNVEYSVFSNQYPEFADTNNLSLVLFLHHPGLSIVFPGDLEKAGWKTLLQNVGFQAHLKRVNIFVASHHGRDNGYVPEVFEYCKPAIIVISDEAVQYATQEHSYTQHARGITWNQTDVRKVLTTRKDGMLTISSTQQGFHVQASK